MVGQLSYQKQKQNHLLWIKELIILKSKTKLELYKYPRSNECSCELTRSMERFPSVLLKKPIIPKKRYFLT